MTRSLLNMKAEILKALSHPTRLAVVELLGTAREKCVCEIAEVVCECDRTTLSKHLSILKSAGVISDRKDGLKIFYRLNCPCVTRFFSCIEQMVRDRVRAESTALTATQPVHRERRKEVV